MTDRAPADPTGESFTLNSAPELVQKGIGSVMSSSALLDLSEADRASAELILAEVLNNIGEHAYCGTYGSIRLWLAREGDELVLCFEDGGSAMPDEHLPEGRLPDPTTLPEGGFGWYLIRTLASDLRYERRSGRNLLQLRLPLGQCGA